MATAFPGFPREGLRFLDGLAADNTRDCFQANKATYEKAIKAPMVALVEAINAALDGRSAAYRADPKKAIGRINRDTRFSADKSPYKTEVSAVFPRTGKSKEQAAGFYFAVSPRGVEVIGGAYMPDPPSLANLRAALAARHAALRKIVADKALVKLMGHVQGEQLKRVPQPYPADHPAADLLRYKQIYLHAQLPAAVAATPKLLDEIVARFRAMTPFVEFLDDALAG